jgi:hypothetical protein
MSVKFGLNYLDTKTRSEEGRWVEIVHPATGKPTGVELFLFGPDSRQYSLAEARVKQQEMDRARARDQIKRDEIESDVLEREEEIRREFLVEVTHSWRGVIDDKGANVPITDENLKAFYTAYPVAQRQAIRFLDNINNWLLETEKNSSSGQSGASDSAGEAQTAETLSHL